MLKNSQSKVVELIIVSDKIVQKKLNDKCRFPYYFISLNNDCKIGIEEIVDTNGHENFKVMRSAYNKHGNGFILLYSTSYSDFL